MEHASFGLLGSRVAFANNGSRIKEEKEMSGGMYNKVGNSMFGPNGSISSHVGSSTYNSNGTFGNRIGDTLHLSNGVTVNKIGDSFTCSNGKTYHKIRNTLFGPDGCFFSGLGSKKMSDADAFDIIQDQNTKKRKPF